MNALVRVSKVIVIGALVLWLLPYVLFTKVPPGGIGIRQSAVSGVDEDDLSPGWTLRVIGIHKVLQLPTSYFFLDYVPESNAGKEPLQIRTKDNNNVVLDISVPIRIKPGEAHDVVKAGNHIKDPDGRYRYMRLADAVAVSVLREELANLDSVGFYSTTRRVEITKVALELLNTKLADLHLEAQAVLIRAVKFRDEYEQQLQQIQLNEQNKLLDNARQKVAVQQQGLDNFQQGTAAQASAREQDWVKRRAELERAYQVGSIETVDSTPGAARRAMEALPPEKITELRTKAAKIFGLDDPASVSEGYLLGIKNVEAETLEYKNRLTAEADGISARLEAEGAAMMSKVQGEYESRINALLSTPAGRAYVAWKTADNVTFAKSLTFSSSDGIPSVLRLRQFALLFMGGQ